MIKKVIHVRPMSGGVAEYAKTINAIYTALGIEVTDMVVEDKQAPKQLLDELVQSNTLVHFEVGASDGKLFELSRALLKRTTQTQLLTIHDPGVVVWHPWALTGLITQTNPIIQFGGKALRKGIGTIFGASVIARHLANPNVRCIYLRPDLADRPGSFYLPQPLYHATPPKARKYTPQLVTLGYSGYWGLGKGLEILLQAWSRLNSERLTLVISGGTAKKEDAYYRSIKALIDSLGVKPELPGFIAADQLDDFLRSLDTLILPYSTSLPNGTSAMALRAAELGVPIIATKVPSLQKELGEGPIYIEPDNTASLIEAIMYAQDNWKAVQQQAISVQQKIISLHSWEYVGFELEKILASI